EEQDEIREGDFEELKQDIQMLRFEMMNRLDETRDDLARNSLLLNEGVLVVGELLSSLTWETNPLIKENFYSFKKKFFSTLDQIRLIDSGKESSDTTTSTNTASALSTTSMPNLINHSNSLQTMSTSASEPSLSTNKSNYSDMNPVKIVKHLSAAHITLSNIVEENEENDDESKTKVVEKNEGNGNDSKTKEVEEIEVEARHISIQTSMPNGDGDGEKLKDDITVFKL
ncbi:unnamed protein product, partial [Rotaria magnacalcarata]